MDRVRNILALKVLIALFVVRPSCFQTYSRRSLQCSLSPAEFSHERVNVTRGSYVGKEQGANTTIEIARMYGTDL